MYLLLVLGPIAFIRKTEYLIKSYLFCLYWNLLSWSFSWSLSCIDSLLILTELLRIEIINVIIKHIAIKFVIYTLTSQFIFHINNCIQATHKLNRLCIYFIKFPLYLHLWLINIPFHDRSVFVICKGVQGISQIWSILF